MPIFPGMALNPSPEIPFSKILDISAPWHDGHPKKLMAPLPPAKISQVRALSLGRRKLSLSGRELTSPLDGLGFFEISRRLKIFFGFYLIYGKVFPSNKMNKQQPK